MSTWTLVIMLIARNPIAIVSCKQETETKIGMCRVTEQRSVAIVSTLLTTVNFFAKVSSTWTGTAGLLSFSLTIYAVHTILTRHSQQLHVDTTQIRAQRFFFILDNVTATTITRQRHENKLGLSADAREKFHGTVVRVSRVCR